jgi:fibronectin type 3 domain-containing protein/C1A family cysteine protease
MRIKISSAVFQIATLVFFASLQLEAQISDTEMKQGGIEPTQEEIRWAEQNLIKSTNVRLNNLGLKRIQENTEQKSLKPDTLQSLKGEKLIADNPLEEVIVPQNRGILPAPPAGDGTNPTTDSPIEESVSQRIMMYFPSSVDNSTLSSFPPIRSQGYQSSCVSFSIAYYQLTHEVGMLRGWNNKNQDDSTKFSPKFLYNLVNWGNDRGSSWYGNYRALEIQGSALWSEFPYSEHNRPETNYREWPLEGKTWLHALEFRPAEIGSFPEPSEDSSSIAAMKTMLLNGHVLICGTYICSWRNDKVCDDTSTQLDNPYVGNLIVTMVDSTYGSHSLTIVGYNDNIWVDLNGDDRVQPEEKGAWKVCNSWGITWANDGFGWIAYDAMYPVSKLKNVSSGPNRVKVFQDHGIHWVIPKDYYKPKLVGKLRISHPKRDQLCLMTGISDASLSEPEEYFGTSIANDGGPYSFAGNSTNVDLFTYFDFTNIAPVIPENKNYYLVISDLFQDSDNRGVCKEFSLIDLYNNDSLACGMMPLTTTNETAYAYVNYSFNGQNEPPIASFTASMTRNYLTIDFDGRASADSRDQIVAWHWNFGDGYTGMGSKISHTYSSAGRYDVELIVVDSWGEKDTMIQSLDVLCVPSAPGGVKALSGPACAYISWNIAPHAQSYNIYRSKGLKDSFSPVARGITNTSYTDVSLIAGDKYYYEVKSENNYGISMNSNTAAVVVGAPDVPSNVTLTPGNWQIEIRWTKENFPNDRDPVTYIIKRSNSLNGTYTTIASNVTSTVFVNSGLVNGTIYYYQVLAQNSYGISVPSPKLTAKPFGLPATPTSITIAAASSQIQIQWKPSLWATSYTVKRSLTKGGPYTTVGSNLTNLSHIDQELPKGSTFYYVVCAVNPLKESDPSTEVNAATGSLPLAPVNLNVNFNRSGVTLTWSNVFGALRYNVKKGIESGTYTQIFTTENPVFEDTSVKAGVIYYYSVSAVNDIGEGRNSQEITADLIPTDLRLEYKIGDVGSPQNNSVQPNFRISNLGTSPIALSDLKIKYFFTADSGNRKQSFSCDYARIEGNALPKEITYLVKGYVRDLVPSKPTADAVIEISFSSRACNLEPGEYIQIFTRVQKSQDWSPYNELNDYSYKPQTNNYVEWQRVTLEVNGVTVWGLNP